MSLSTGVSNLTQRGAGVRPFEYTIYSNPGSTVPYTPVTPEAEGPFDTAGPFFSVNSNQINTLWGGACVIVFIWLALSTILFPIFLVGLNNRNTRIEEEFARDDVVLQDEIDDLGTAAEEFNTTLNQFLGPCVQLACASGIYPEILKNAVLKGCWNASTNTPTLTNSNGRIGDLYVVCISGNATTLNGISTWLKNDLVMRVANYTPSGGVDAWVTFPKGGVTINDASGGTGESFVVKGTGNPLLLATLQAAGNITFVQHADYIEILINGSTPGSQVIPYSSLPGPVVDTVPSGVNATVLDQTWTQVGEDIHVTFTVQIPFNNGGTPGLKVSPVSGFFTVIVPILPDFPHNPWCGMHRTVVPPGSAASNDVLVKIAGSNFDLTESPDELDFRWRVDVVGALTSDYRVKFYCVWNGHTPPAGYP